MCQMWLKVQFPLALSGTQFDPQLKTFDDVLLSVTLQTFHL